MSVMRPNSLICEHAAYPSIAAIGCRQALTNGEATRPHRRCWTDGLDIGKRRPARLVATVEDRLNWWALASRSKSLAQMNKSEDASGATKKGTDVIIQKMRIDRVRKSRTYNPSSRPENFSSATHHQKVEETQTKLLHSILDVVDAGQSPFAQ
jgi:hypothetical protein